MKKEEKSNSTRMCPNQTRQQKHIPGMSLAWNFIMEIGTEGTYQLFTDF